MVDADLNDSMLIFVLEAIQTIKAVLGDLFIIKGLNFNGNNMLTDVSMKALVEFSKNNLSIKVLSIEKFKVSFQGLN